MQLYYSETLAPRKACTVARYLGLPIEYVFVDLGKGEHVAPAYLAINPNGKVPCLVDGERSIWEADAIICHLAQRARSPLWPQNAEQQTDALRWLSWNSQHFYRHGGTLYFEHLIKPAIGLGGPDSAKVAEAQGWFRKHAAVLDRHLENRKWLLGDAMSIADFSVAVTLPYASSAAMPLGEFPSVVRWHDRLNELEAWRNPFPSRQTEAAAA
ncbi:glutathione S-transferase [Burkholderia sp. OAS925]|uniref:Glutathione S-transferase domain n=1 Tax=Paraburkholderia graminis (strain ATCC 700544 / DSM 17151 / LMG 18924 / NCIMB 13744 / C4D1M) TaxID=396598 RepID=B1FTT5_PARG4|nr:glutathione S-transferase family protein [Paraburkholderia graminis]EDT13093.1 Glutathione S-transferase domain [Paraburkholderia graminis C4D1M]MDR6469942.1 glutathione S-transferase [Paraburkholderia graminis]MDR6476051.1 glutathione S-transferase [Paraburkholderia graminis]CAB3718504.1 Disulfide-bond oxidoreductase YfcG [Paraburkholderia graminis C4D1M]